MLDFNHSSLDLAYQTSRQRPKLDRDAIRAALIDKLPLLALEMFPAGKYRHNKYLIGDLSGHSGESLELILMGPKAGLWTDRATGEGGDVLALFARRCGLDMRTEFKQVLDKAQEWLGHSFFIPANAVSKHRSKTAVSDLDDLGPVTAKWNYQDAQGHLIAVVKRYDPPGRRKQFRPWDAKLRRAAPPDPRPLFNQPGVFLSTHVVLVEGEKCAQALIDLGVCATTAMQGANAPIDKTDWAPLIGKHVLIWPDRDKPGWEYAHRAYEVITRLGSSSCTILMPPQDKPTG